ncbi:GlxA family transcriptional regulator [Bradyrhizobium sp. SSUT18]|uniref:GlxA family transcriptional regulator n=1 Tax=Bradyrhizobium sp. SSUT18 TaxID=3040602 RepID=UPI002447716B|nr:GlxA family transcriptional regulator [Bradyrhizobium sp. SSUT18]MDH2406554.1 GlxA family transcriptional regulator [Bradyrhizobium sp. SSUT18]
MNQPNSRKQRAPQNSLSVAFVLLPNFTLTAFSCMVDLLRLAADEGDRSRPQRCSWTVLGADLNPITSSCGLQVAPWETFSQPERFDYVVVIGGLISREMNYDPVVLRFLQKVAAASIPIVGVCTGSFALAEAGLLKGRKCCVSWFHFFDFLERYAGVVPVADQLFIVDGSFITCPGGLAALDLGAWMIERHLGPGLVQKGLHIMLTDKARSGFDAQPQPPGVGPVADERVKRAMLLIEQNLSTPPKVEEIAAKIGLSKRQLERLFRKIAGKSIQEFSRGLRTYYGLWLLANSTKSITEIAFEAGFSDPSHFNRLFRATFGCSPSAMRSEGADAIRTIIQNRQDAAAALPADDRASTPEALNRSFPDWTGFLQKERRPYLQ